MSVSVFIPSHITGFFSIKNDKNPLRKGSCGAGVLIDKGVITKIKSSMNKSKNVKQVKSPNNNLKSDLKNNLKDDLKDKLKNYLKNEFINIIINGKKDLKNEKITLKTIQIMEKHYNLKIEDDVYIDHSIEVPIGAGFGTSASCALGTAIGISKYYDLNLSKEKMGQIAHLAEVSLGSGLGDVLSQTSKGVVIRESPGAPGIGKTKPINLFKSVNMSKKSNILKDTCPKLTQNKEIDDLIVLTKTFGEIDTSSIIQNTKHEANIDKIGSLMQKKINKSPTMENFMKYSYQFAMKTNLISEEVLEIVKTLEKFSIRSSMAMLGNTVFAIVTQEKIHELKGINISDFKISKIDTNGIRLFNKR